MSVRLADERGFSLVELMTTMVVAGVILFALFGLVDTATRRQGVATDRLDANDRGRGAMDIIASQLRSRVCVSGTQGSIVAGTATQIEFFASFGLTGVTTTASQQLVLQRRRLTYRPAPDNDIREEVWIGAAAAPVLPPGPPANPTRTRTVLSNVALVRPTNDDGVEITGATPIPFLRYYPTALPLPALTPALAVPLVAPVGATPPAAVTTTKVARIDISFAAEGKTIAEGKVVKADGTIPQQGKVLRADGTVPKINTPFANQILDRSPGCYFG
jgi:prepilin-type N-terminal cleavage/methylation domain-containing protein